MSCTHAILPYLITIYRWWKSQLEKKKAERSGPYSKLPRPTKFSSHKQIHSKQSSTQVPSLSSRGFRSVEASSDTTSKSTRVIQRTKTGNRKLDDHERSIKSKPTTIISKDEDSLSVESDDNVKTQPGMTRSKPNTPIMPLGTARNEADSEEDTEHPHPKPFHNAHGKRKSSNKRYILFLGNLSESSTHEDIVTHFKKRGVPIKELRLLTHKDSKKSRGCAFAEFDNEKCFQNALKFHRSKLNGKTINIEVTCGGGGASVKRKTKIINKNRKQRIARARFNK